MIIKKVFSGFIKKMKRIFISTTTFAQYTSEPIQLLTSQGYDVAFNNLGRKLSEEEIKNIISDYDGIIAGTETYSNLVLAKATSLKVISRIGVGIDNINLEAAEKKGIKTYKTSTTPAPAVAELVLGMMIDVSRHISKSHHSLRNGNWKKEMGRLLRGKTLGIIGLGVIGRELVKISKGFGFNILAFEKYKDLNYARIHKVTYCDLEFLLTKSDVISIHLNLSEETKYIIDFEKIKLMKSDAILINASRGEIIDENALYNALKSNKIAGAALDVFESEPYSGPLSKLDNVVLTPHIGAYARELRAQMEIEATENLIKGLNET